MAEKSIEARRRELLAELNAAAAAKRRLPYYGSMNSSPRIVREIPPAVYAQYNSLLGIGGANAGRETAEIIIANLIGSKRANTNTRDYFSTIASAGLPSVTLAADADSVVASLTTPDGVVRLHLLKRGSYGVVWRGENGKVYKFIDTSAPPDRTPETATREVFLEMLIQVLLQSDPDMGKHIGHVERLYKYSTGYACEMEVLDTDLQGKLMGLNGGNKVTLRQIQPILETLGRVVTYFNKKYGFNHRDLHGGNIMFKADGTLKIIDFGRSCVSINGTIYSLSYTTCDSLDPFLFLAYLLEVLPEYFDDTAIKRMNDYFTATHTDDITGREITINYLKEITDWHNANKKDQLAKAIWHYFYLESIIGERVPGAPVNPPTKQPWIMKDDLTTLARLRATPIFPADTTFWQRFEMDGMFLRGSFEFFARAWGPGGIPSRGGARATRRRRAKVSRRPKATRRFKY